MSRLAKGLLVGLIVIGCLIFASALAGGLLAASVLINLVVAGCDVFAVPTAPSQLSWVWREHLLRGHVTSVASDWWGWPGWTGFAVWAALALPALGWLTRQTRLHRNGPQVRMVG